jgi:mRNA interferase HigB
LSDNNCNQTVTDAFENWRRIIEENDFANINELRAIFNSVDYVGNDRYVFDILGNHYRLITMIHFKVRTAYILFVGNHVEYNKIDASTVCYKK